MKHTAFLLIAIAFPAGALAQALPDNPPPAATPSSSSDRRLPPPSMWDRIQHLPRGEKIKIRIAGRWERCQFAGATDEFLYCAPAEDSDAAQEWPVARLNIADFKPDHDERNGRLIFTSVTLGTGLALGIRSYQNPGDYTPTASGWIGGLLGTGIGAVAGAGLSCFSGHCVKLPSLNPGPPAYGFNVNLPVRGIPLRPRR